MRQIDIDSLDEATLIELNARIVERLQLLHENCGSPAGYQSRKRRNV